MSQAIPGRGQARPRENCIVPDGTRVYFPLHPPLKRWAKIFRPFGACFPVERRGSPPTAANYRALWDDLKDGTQPTVIRASIGCTINISARIQHHGGVRSSGFASLDVEVVE